MLSEQAKRLALLAQARRDAIKDALSDAAQDDEVTERIAVMSAATASGVLAAMRQSSHDLELEPEVKHKRWSKHAKTIGAALGALAAIGALAKAILEFL